MRTQTAQAPRQRKAGREDVVSEYDGSEDPLRGAERRQQREILSQADCAADRGASAPRRDTRKNGVEPGDRRSTRGVPRTWHHDSSLRAGGADLAPEFTGDSSRQLFCVSVTDCLADSFFPRRGTVIRRAALAALRHADFGDGAHQFLERYSIFMDYGLARGGGLVPGRASFRNVGVRNSLPLFRHVVGSTLRERKTD